MRCEFLRHRFVEYIPDRLEEGVLYISVEYLTVTHLCCCGCGQEVSTTLSPTDWRLIFDGKTVSLEPSIGSWGLPCQSHYFITRSRVVWADKWSTGEIETGRRIDAARKSRPVVDESLPNPPVEPSVPIAPNNSRSLKDRLLGWMKRWIR